MATAIIGSQSQLVLRSRQTTPLPITTIDGNLKYLENLALTNASTYPYVNFSNLNVGPINNASSFAQPMPVYHFQSRAISGDDDGCTADGLFVITPPLSSWITTLNSPSYLGRRLSVGLHKDSDYSIIFNESLTLTGSVSTIDIVNYFSQGNIFTEYLEESDEISFAITGQVPPQDIGRALITTLSSNSDNIVSVEVVGQAFVCSAIVPTNLQIGRKYEFKFDGNYFADSDADLGAWSADGLWGPVLQDPFFGTPDFSTGKIYTLNIMPFAIITGGPTLKFEIDTFSIVSNFNPTVVPDPDVIFSTASYIMRTTMVSGQSVESFASFSSNRYHISLTVENTGPRQYRKTSSFQLSEAQFNYSLLMSTTTFVSVDVNPFRGGIKSSWITELQGLVNSNVKQNFIITDIDNPDNSITFEVSSITEFSQTKTSIIGRLVNQSGAIIDSQDCTFNFMAPVVEPGGPILQYNGGFWYNDDFPPEQIIDGELVVFDPFSYRPPNSFFKEVRYRSLQDQEIGPYEFIFSHTGADNATINYGAWFDNIKTAGGYTDPNFNYGDGQSILHIVEYQQNNTSPTNSTITKADFRIFGFGYTGPTPLGQTFSIAQCILISGQGRITDYPEFYPNTPPVEDLGPRLFFVSVTIVPIVGSRSGVGVTGPSGESGILTVSRNTSPENFPNSFEYLINSTFQGQIVSLSVNQIDTLGLSISNYISLKSYVDSGINPLINIVQKETSSYLTMKVSSYFDDQNLTYFNGKLVAESQTPIDLLSDSLLTYFPYPVNDPTPIIPINGSFWDFIGTTPSGPTPSSGQFLNRDNVDDIIVGVTYSFDFSRYDADSASNDYQKWFDHLYESGNTQNSVLHLSEYNPTNTSPAQSTISFGDFKILSFNGKSTSFDVMCMSGKGSLSKITPGGGLSPKTFFVSYTIVGNSGGGIGGSTRTDAFTSVTSTTINHNFGFYPMVQVFDTDGLLFIPENIVHQSINTLVVDFSSTSSGTIITSGGAPTGSLVLSSTIVPTYSGSTGQYGETRLGLSESNPYLYVYTDQWYRFLGATF